MENLRKNIVLKLTKNEFLGNSVNEGKGGAISISVDSIEII